MALTTNVARDPEWDLKPRTWHKEPGRNPGRVSHDCGTENQKGTLEESATNVAQRTRKEPWKSQPRLWHRESEKESWRRADRRRTERSRPATPRERERGPQSLEVDENR